MEAFATHSFFSCIILNWNRANDLIELLESLKRQTCHKFETIVVDNGSVDNSIDVVSKKFPDVKIIQLKENIGVSGFSVGVDHAIGKYVVLLDNDTIVSTDFIEELYLTVNTYPDFSVFALNILTPEGRRQKDYLPNEISKPIAWHNFIGGGVAFLTSDYRESGGYDPKYFVYINETELAARMLLSGKKILYCPQIKVTHKTSASARLINLNYFYYLRNSIFFMKSYFELYKRIDLILGLLIINMKFSIKGRQFFTYLKSIISGFKNNPSYKPKRKLNAGLAENFANSWQGNPALTQILKNKLWGK